MIFFALAAATAAPAATRRVQDLWMTPVSATMAATEISIAEREFAKLAQIEGQWHAFRDFAAPDAIMFVPTLSAADPVLANSTEPAVPVMWWPGIIAHSCDATLGVDTGSWILGASGGKGTFTTVWRKTARGYRWQLDQGRPTPQFIPVGTAPKVIAPVCGAGASNNSAARAAAYDRLAASVAASAGAEGASAFAANATSDVLVQAEGVMPVRGPAALPPTRFGAALASGHADDWTLAWASRALLGGAAGAHDLRVWQWRGDAGWKLVMYETIGLK